MQVKNYTGKLGGAQVLNTRLSLCLCPFIIIIIITLFAAHTRTQQKYQSTSIAIENGTTTNGEGGIKTQHRVQTTNF